MRVFRKCLLIASLSANDSAVNLADLESILVIKPSSLGDIVHTLPAVELLHRAAPEAKITWLANSEWLPLLEGIAHIEERIAFPRREFRGPIRGAKAFRWIRENVTGLQPDLTLDFQGLFRSAHFARKAAGKQTVGFRQSREGARFSYDQVVDIPDWNRCHAVDRNIQLVNACGVSGKNIRDLSVPPGEAVEISGLGDDEPFLLLHPFSRGEGKSLSQAEVVDLCENLAPFPVVIAGAGVEWDTSVSAVPDNAHCMLGGTSLAELIYLVHRADWTVSVDSGPMHLAAAITDRVLSIHTWSDPMMVGPWRKEAFIWREDQIWRVEDLEAGQFPERRDQRREFAGRPRLIPEDQLERITSFLKQQLET